MNYNLETHLDDIFTKLLLCEREPMSKIKAQALDINNFPEINVDFGIHESLGEDPYGEFFSGTERPAILGKHVDISMLFKNGKEYNEPCVQRVRAVKPKDVRGLTDVFFPEMVELSTLVFIKDTAFYDPTRVVYAYLNKEWKLISKLEFEKSRGDISGGTVTHGISLSNDWYDQEAISFRVSAACHIAFAYDYLFRVIIQYKIGPRITFVSTPEQIRALFKKREVQHGKQRRTMIRNWVTDHFRTLNRDDEKSDVWVKKHIRGATTFKWEDYTVTIIPPKEVLKSVEEQNIKKRELLIKEGRVK